ncbi:hypothetical protein MMC29_004710 [Sticta canariensis]|nr:hypothetical protein [Sticta canariensis]
MQVSAQLSPWQTTELCSASAAYKTVLSRVNEERKHLIAGFVAVSWHPQDVWLGQRIRIAVGSATASALHVEQNDGALMQQQSVRFVQTNTLVSRLQGLQNTEGRARLLLWQRVLSSELSAQAEGCSHERLSLAQVLEVQQAARLQVPSRGFEIMPDVMSWCGALLDSMELGVSPYHQQMSAAENAKATDSSAKRPGHKGVHSRI